MTKLLLAIKIDLSSTFAHAQLQGSGKTITKIMTTKKISTSFLWRFRRKIDVEIGKPWSIAITIDDT
jgi:hypothetical protein